MFDSRDQTRKSPLDPNAGSQLVPLPSPLLLDRTGGTFVDTIAGAGKPLVGTAGPLPASAWTARELPGTTRPLTESASGSAALGAYASLLAAASHPASSEPAPTAIAAAPAVDEALVALKKEFAGLKPVAPAKPPKPEDRASRIAEMATLAAGGQVDARQQLLALADGPAKERSARAAGWVRMAREDFSTLPPASIQAHLETLPKVSVAGGTRERPYEIAGQAARGDLTSQMELVARVGARDASAIVSAAGRDLSALSMTELQGHLGNTRDLLRARGITGYVGEQADPKALATRSLAGDLSAQAQLVSKFQAEGAAQLLMTGGRSLSEMERSEVETYLGKLPPPAKPLQAADPQEALRKALDLARGAAAGRRLEPQAQLVALVGSARAADFIAASGRDLATMSRADLAAHLATLPELSPATPPASWDALFATTQRLSESALGGDLASQAELVALVGADDGAGILTFFGSQALARSKAPSPTTADAWREHLATLPAFPVPPIAANDLQLVISATRMATGAARGDRLEQAKLATLLGTDTAAAWLAAAGADPRRMTGAELSAHFAAMPHVTGLDVPEPARTGRSLAIAAAARNGDFPAGFELVSIAGADRAAELVEIAGFVPGRDRDAILAHLGRLPAVEVDLSGASVEAREWTALSIAGEAKGDLLARAHLVSLVGAEKAADLLVLAASAPTRQSYSDLMARFAHLPGSGAEPASLRFEEVFDASRGLMERIRAGDLVAEAELVSLVGRDKAARIVTFFAGAEGSGTIPSAPANAAAWQGELSRLPPFPVPAAHLSDSEKGWRALPLLGAARQGDRLAQAELVSVLGHVRAADLLSRVGRPLEGHSPDRLRTSLSGLPALQLDPMAFFARPAERAAYALSLAAPARSGDVTAQAQLVAILGLDPAATLLAGSGRPIESMSSVERDRHLRGLPEVQVPSDWIEARRVEAVYDLLPAAAGGDVLAQAMAVAALRGDTGRFADLVQAMSADVLGMSQSALEAHLGKLPLPAIHPPASTDKDELVRAGRSGDLRAQAELVSLLGSRQAARSLLPPPPPAIPTQPLPVPAAAGTGPRWEPATFAPFSTQVLAWKDASGRLQGTFTQEETRQLGDAGNPTAAYRARIELQNRFGSKWTLDPSGGGSTPYFKDSTGKVSAAVTQETLDRLYSGPRWTNQPGVGYVDATGKLAGSFGQDEIGRFGDEKNPTGDYWMMVALRSSTAGAADVARLAVESGAWNSTISGPRWRPAAPLPGQPGVPGGLFEDATGRLRGTFDQDLVRTFGDEKNPTEAYWTAIGSQGKFVRKPVSPATPDPGKINADPYYQRGGQGDQYLRSNPYPTAPDDLTLANVARNIQFQQNSAVLFDPTRSALEKAIAQTYLSGHNIHSINVSLGARVNVPSGNQHENLFRQGGMTDPHQLTWARKMDQDWDRQSFNEAPYYQRLAGGADPIAQYLRDNPNPSAPDHLKLAIAAQNLQIQQAGSAHFDPGQSALGKGIAGTFLDFTNIHAIQVRNGVPTQLPAGNQAENLFREAGVTDIATLAWARARDVEWDSIPDRPMPALLGHAVPLGDASVTEEAPIDDSDLTTWERGIVEKYGPPRKGMYRDPSAPWNEVPIGSGPVPTGAIANPIVTPAPGAHIPGGPRNPDGLSDWAREMDDKYGAPPSGYEHDPHRPWEVVPDAGGPVRLFQVPGPSGQWTAVDSDRTKHQQFGPTNATKGIWNAPPPLGGAGPVLLAQTPKLDPGNGPGAPSKHPAVHAPGPAVDAPGPAPGKPSNIPGHKSPAPGPALTLDEKLLRLRQLCGDPYSAPDEFTWLMNDPAVKATVTRFKEIRAETKFVELLSKSTLLSGPISQIQPLLSRLKTGLDAINVILTPLDQFAQTNSQNPSTKAFSAGAASFAQLALNKTPGGSAFNTLTGGWAQSRINEDIRKIAVSAEKLDPDKLLQEAGRLLSNVRQLAERQGQGVQNLVVELLVGPQSRKMPPPPPPSGR